jgi:F0F1-type ATP synthase membrane subunit b/b'
MNILTALGVNSTLWIQLGCFLVAYVALTQLVFKPYMAAFHERITRTIGNEEYAQRILQEVADLQTQYEVRARELNDETKSIFDQTRVAAMRDYDKTISAARQETTDLLEKTRIQIAVNIREAQTAVMREAPDVGRVIASKLMGKEVAQ